MFVAKNDSRDEFNHPCPTVYNSYRQAWQAALDEAADYWYPEEVYLESTASEEESEFQPGTIVAKVKGMTYYVYQVHLAVAEKNCFASHYITKYIHSLMDLEAPDSIYKPTCDEVGTIELWNGVARKMLAAAVAVAPPATVDSMMPVSMRPVSMMPVE